MKRLKVFIFNALILTVTSLILRILGTFFGVYISNKIGEEALGVFGLIMSVYVFGITLASSGINLSCMRIVSEELAKGNEYLAKKAAQRCTTISFICGICASLFLFINSNFIVDYCFHNKVHNNIVYLICIALPFTAVSSSINGYFSAVRRVYKSSITQVIEQLTKYIASFYLLSLFTSNTLEGSCYALILGDVISEIVSMVFIYILYYFDKRNKKFTYARNFASLNKRILTISFPLAITSYIRSALSTLKQILIPKGLEKSGLKCEIALSNYGIIGGMAMPIILFPSLFISSFSSLLIPEFSRYHIKNDYKRIKQVSSYILILTFVVSIFIFFLLFIFADFLSIKFYNTLDVSFYIKILAPLVLFMYLDNVIDSILKGLDCQVSVMFVNILDLLISLLIIYFAIPYYGINGYITSLYISEILNFLCSLGILILKINTRRLSRWVFINLFLLLNHTHLLLLQFCIL